MSAIFSKKASVGTQSQLFHVKHRTELNKASNIFNIYLLILGKHYFFNLRLINITSKL